MHFNHESSNSYLRVGTSAWIQWIVMPPGPARIHAEAKVGFKSLSHTKKIDDIWPREKFPTSIIPLTHVNEKPHTVVAI